MTDIIEEQEVRQYHIDRPSIIAALQAKYGDECFYCHRDFTERERTIDHYYPQSVAYAEGWTRQEVWAVDNLRLACKPCNSKKGSLIPNPDGSIPAKGRSTFRYRRDRRANRPDEPCAYCDNGHNLFIGEVCAQCGVNAQQYPRHAKVKFAECEENGHSINWCWACSIGVVPRTGALEMLFFGVEGQEDGYLEG